MIDQLLGLSYAALWGFVLIQGLLLYFALRQIGLLHLRTSIETGPVPLPSVPVGAPAQPFALPDTRGVRVTLDQFPGRPVALAFVSPSCAPCRTLAAEMRRFIELPVASRAEVLFISLGNLEANRGFAEELQIPFPVLTGDGYQASPDYKIPGTPWIVLLDEKARIRGAGGANTAQQLEHLIIESLPDHSPADLPWGAPALSVMGGRHG